MAIPHEGMPFPAHTPCHVLDSGPRSRETTGKYQPNAVRKECLRERERVTEYCRRSQGQTPKQRLDPAIVFAAVRSLFRSLRILVSPQGTDSLFLRSFGSSVSARSCMQRTGMRCRVFRKAARWRSGGRSDHGNDPSSHHRRRRDGRGHPLGSKLARHPRRSAGTGRHRQRSHWTMSRPAALRGPLCRQGS